MALSSGTYPWVGEVTVAAATIGEVSANTTELTSLTVPAWVDTTYVPHVVAPDLDTGLIVGGAWVDSAGVVKVAIGNVTGSPITPASAITFKVIIL